MYIYIIIQVKPAHYLLKLHFITEGKIKLYSVMCKFVIKYNLVCTVM